jgi:GrpB-like predicted nucleotidyltransferase (UPF0157 family)
MEPIHLYPHSPEWLQRFESEKCLLKNAIGDIAVAYTISEVQLYPAF